MSEECFFIEVASLGDDLPGMETASPFHQDPTIPVPNDGRVMNESYAREYRLELLLRREIVGIENVEQRSMRRSRFKLIEKAHVVSRPDRHADQQELGIDWKGLVWRPPTKGRVL